MFLSIRIISSFRTQELLLMCLVAITIAAPILHHFSLNKSVVWEFPTTMKTEIVNDHADGGSSIAQLIYTDSSLILSYSLQPGSNFPLAGIKFHTAENEKGKNLTNFDSVKVWLNSTDTINTVKIIFKNYNPAYSTIDDPVSFKYNEIEYKPNTHESPFSFAIQDLTVPSWWIGQRQIPIEHIRPDLSNIVELEIPTGSTHKINNAQIELSKIVLSGKYIAAEVLYLFILFIWMFSAVAYLVFRFLHQISLNKELKKQSENLKTAAERDSLTQTLNRNGMFNKIEELKNLPPEHSFPISVIMMDIDFFKKINDTYGHAVGDEVLKNFTVRIQGTIRSRDLLIRWGGEEFIVICLNTHLKQGVILAEKLRLSLIDTPIHNLMSVRISCGVASTSHWDIEEVIEKADMALYQAKSQGRNKVCHTPV